MLYAHIKMHRIDYFKLIYDDQAETINNFQCSFKVCINSTVHLVDILNDAC
jgi:hypothetical protein